jgi:Ca2+:H+ antiporter
MQPLRKEIRHTPLLWMLVFVPAVLVAEKAAPHSHTWLFVLAVLAIVPLAALLSHATEAVAAKTGDAVGGLLNATLGNLTELIIAISALRAGQYMLVKASIAGAIVTNVLFMLGACLLIGGLGYHVQEFNRSGGRLYSGLLLMATVALLAPSAVADLAQGEAIMQKLSVGLAILLIVAYGLGLLFSLKTHKELFASAEHNEGEAHWPIGLAVGTLLVVTVLVALVSEIFVESVQKAAESFGMSPAFVGFIIVALVGAAAEFAVALSAARKDRLDMSVSIALGSASQIALFVAPALVLLSYLVGPSPMSLQFWPGAVTMVMIATVTAVSGTISTSCDVRLESGMRTKADVRRPLPIMGSHPCITGAVRFTITPCELTLVVAGRAPKNNRHGHQPVGSGPSRSSCIQKDAVVTNSLYRWVIVAAGGLLGCVAIGGMFSLPVLLQPIARPRGGLCWC